MPNFAIRAHNAFGDITSETFRDHPLDERCHELTIVRMNACQVFVERGSVSLRIKAIDAKKFIRPVLKGAYRFEDQDPTADVTKALRFGQVIDDIAKLLFILPEILIELPKHKRGLVENS